MSTDADESRIEAAANSVDPSDGTISRTAAAQLLGVSKSTVRRLEETGALHPKIDHAGVHWIDIAEVVRMAGERRRAVQTSPTDELAARAFELFGECVSLRDVVLQLRLSPERVTALHDQWRRLGAQRDLWLKPEHQDVLADLIGDFRSTAELVERVEKLFHRLADAEERLEHALVLSPSMDNESTPAT